MNTHTRAHVYTEVKDYNERLYQVQDLIFKMPEANRNTLKYLCLHLQRYVCVQMCLRVLSPHIHSLTHSHAHAHTHTPSPLVDSHVLMCEVHAGQSYRIVAYLKQKNKHGTAIPG